MPKKLKMMICPGKGECPIIKNGLRCNWPEQHEQNQACSIGHNTPDCPACIPYVEPSPKDKCLRCGKDTNGYKVCNECWQAQHRKSQPETRPLIDDLDNKFSETICSACLQGMQRDTCPYPQPCNGLHDALVNIKLLFQAWHKNEVQQVRKDLIEEVVKYTEKQIIYPSSDIRECQGWNNAVSDILAHLRAMAEKE